MLKQYIQAQKILVLGIISLWMHTISAADRRPTIDNAKVMQMIIQCSPEVVAITLQAETAPYGPYRMLTVTPMQSIVTGQDIPDSIVSREGNVVSQQKLFEYFQRCCKQGKQEHGISPLSGCYTAAQHKMQHPRQGEAWYLYKNTPFMPGSTYGNCW
jgi:hypothetical protein